MNLTFPKALGLSLLLIAIGTAAPARAASGWVVSYDDKGGVTLTAGTKVVFSDANALMLINTNPWHGVYGWSTEPWAANYAHPNKVESTKGDRKTVTFSDPPGQPVQITKQVTEISPREIKILVKMNTIAGAPGNLLDYSGNLPGATYNGSGFSTDGNGYPVDEVSPLGAAWAKGRNGGHGDDMRYNITTATFALKDLNGAPAKIVYTMTETPVSTGTPPNVRAWRVYAGANATPDGFFQVRNTYDFDMTTPFERTVELRIAWKD